MNSNKVAPNAVSSPLLAPNLVLVGNTTGTFSGSGAGLTSLNGFNIATGTISNGRLSPQLAFLNRVTQNFTGETNPLSPNPIHFP
jgi:hypothetical protein